MSTIFETRRLSIRRALANDDDVEFLYSLWTNPEVMIFVGFPHGLRITRDEIRSQMNKRDSSEYDVYLIVELKESGSRIGECKLGRPDSDGISETDVKIMPEYWGQGYGTEIKRGLVEYLFTRTDCRAVKATPNKNNIASQKMQEAVGGKRIGESVFEFPDDMKDYTCPVPHCIYMVTRDKWEQSRDSREFD
jgi:RimJ/RimL family protein N-acetyltransferase